MRLAIKQSLLYFSGMDRVMIPVSVQQTVGTLDPGPPAEKNTGAPEH